MQSQQWALFIDESGNFADTQSAVVAAGLLLPRGVDAVLERMRDRLEQEIPWLPWPFHGNLYNRLVFPVIVAEAWPDRPGLPPASLAAAEFLRQQCGTALSEVASQFVAYRKFPQQFDSTLRRLENAIVDDPDHKLALSDLRSKTVIALRQQFRDLESAIREGLLPPVLVAAGESQLGDAIGTCWVPARSAEAERFYGALKCLFRRMADALQVIGGDHVVDVEVSGRGLYRRGGTWRELTDFDVRQILDEALQGSTSVVAGVVRVHQFDEQALPALVLADRAANVVWHRTRSGARLGSVENSIRPELFAIRFSRGQPPHLAATGVAQEWVDHAHGRGPQPVRPLEMRGAAWWAIDQSREWIACLAAGSRTGP